MTDITLEDLHRAVDCACKEREKRPDVVRLRRHEDLFVRAMMAVLENGRWKRHLHYRPLTKVNNNGKVRHILSPDLITLIFQHLANNLIWPLYRPLDVHVGLNCKPRCGITANVKCHSVVKRLKYIYYDRRDLHYAVVIDQRHCYDHIEPRMLRKGLKALTRDKWLIDYVVGVTFCEKTFPVGTPTSPLMHHVILLGFDRWLTASCPLAVRYADDVFLPFATKEEAQQMLWRVKQYWWYTYRIRAKSYTQRVINLDHRNDFCGYIIKRNENKSITDHDKGYTSLRRSTYLSAIHSRTNEQYASYYGIMKHADLFRVMDKIERSNMNLKQLTDKIRISRPLDAEEISIEELIEKQIRFTIYDYELRSDGHGSHNWIRCLIGYPEVDETTGELTGKEVARTFTTSGKYLVQFHSLCDTELGKSNILPMEEMLIRKQAGYIYEGSTNMLQHIDKDYQPLLN